ncbi:MULTISPECIES: sporulation peptidase YabG [unclassified Paenibacillus]|uniref:sporulation peptidase YabG n=1 Tax=unclassified Paenibacillus TaxID=185978 RepID=UPI002F410129
MRQGDLVVRKSYGGDVLFRVEAIRPKADQALLKGTDYRLVADSPIEDLTIVDDPNSMKATQEVRIKVNESIKKIHTYRKKHTPGLEHFARLTQPAQSSPYFEVPGKVLHLDGDGNYLKKSMELYKTMNVPAYGIHAQEAQMADILFRVLPEVKPDIVVITGHDGLIKHRSGTDHYSLSSYKNSQNFVNAVRVARQYEKNRDGLVVIAGACQSHFEALMHIGSNFASSPGRILIHALDPVYIAIKASLTSIRDSINLKEVIEGTISGIDGVGGIETLGKYRVGLPRTNTM